jgi:hypothetical protein
MSPKSAAKRSIWHVTFAFALAACSSTPPAPPPEPALAAPDHRRLIAENLKTLFSTDAQVRNVTVSELSQVPSSAGMTWGTCVRVGGATGMTGRPTAPRTYVVTFSRDRIAERRPASGEDCAGAKFSPLG